MKLDIDIFQATKTSGNKKIMNIKAEVTSELNKHETAKILFLIEHTLNTNCLTPIRVHLNQVS